MSKKFIVPETPEELKELVGDQKKLMELGPEDFQATIKAYSLSSVTTLDISNQVAAETQKTLKEWLKEYGVKRPNMMVTEDARKGVGYNPKAIGAKIDSLFDGPADYLKAIWYKSFQGGKVDPRIVELQNYSSAVPDAGGFLLPESLRSELLRVSLETSIVRPRARLIPMDSLRVPFPCIDSTTNQGSVYGGIVVYWTPESGTIALNDAKFGRVVLEAKKLTGACVVPNELLQDSIVSFAAFVNTLLPEAMSFAEDYAFLAGNGAGEPQGVLQSPCLVTVARATDSEVAWVDIVNMYARMLPGSLGRAVWVASINVFPQLAQMALAAASPVTWVTSLAGASPLSILGRPVIFTEKVPALNTEGDIGFYDFGYYLIGDRQVMTASSSEHIRFQEDETMYKVVERVDGRGWLQSPITPKNGSDDLSPFVALTDD